jgi:hypothetical protein
MELLTTEKLTKELMDRMDKYNNDNDWSGDAQISILNGEGYIYHEDFYIFNSSKNGIVSNFWINILCPLNSLPATHDVLNVDIRDLFKEYDISDSEIEMDTNPTQTIKIFEYISQKKELSIIEIINELSSVYASNF